MDVYTDALRSRLLLEDILDQEVERREEELIWNRRKLVYLKALQCADLTNLDITIKRSEGMVNTLKYVLERAFEERVTCERKVRKMLQLRKAASQRRACHKRRSCDTSSTWRPHQHHGLDISPRHDLHLGSHKRPSCSDHADGTHSASNCEALPDPERHQEIYSYILKESVAKISFGVKGDKTQNHTVDSSAINQNPKTSNFEILEKEKCVPNKSLSQTYVKSSPLEQINTTEHLDHDTSRSFSKPHSENTRWGSWVPCECVDATAITPDVRSEVIPEVTPFSLYDTDNIHLKSCSICLSNVMSYSRPS